MRIATIIVAILGLVLGTAIVAYFGFGEVLSALETIGWGGFAIILVYQLTLYLLLGACWWVIAPPPRNRFRAFVWGRLVRDSGSEVLPLSQVGGFVMGARAATLLGPSTAISTATTIVDITIEVLAQLGYTLLGVALLARVHPQATLIYPVAIGIALGIVAIMGFILLQRRGAALVERMSQQLATRWFPGGTLSAKPLIEAIDRVYAHRGSLALGFFLHLLGWVANAIEAWVALKLMGIDLGITAVITIESLLYAIRSAAFAVPNAVGVQEGAYVMLGALFGLSPDMALALSLLKRGRDITIGVPVLLCWQALEGGALMRRRAATDFGRHTVTVEPLAAPHPVGRFSGIYPYALLSLCMLFWAGNWVLGRALRDSMPPVAMTFWRWTVAALVLAPFAVPRLIGKGPVLRRAWPLLLALAITGGAIYQVAVYFGLRHTETINAVLLNAASPLTIVIVAWLIDGDRITMRQVWGTVISLIGLAVVLGRGDPTRIFSLRFSIGDIAILAVMPLWAFYTVMLRRRPMEIDNISLIFLLGVFGTAALAPAYLFESLYIQAPPLAWTSFAAPLYTGCFASAAAYWCWNRGAEMVGANRAGFTTYLMPAFTTVLAVLLLGEEVHLFHAVGIIAILFGVWLSTSSGRKPA